MQVALTLASSNRKTGGIPCSTTEESSCPDSCPFKAGGCYAKGGHQNMHWQKVSKHERGTDWASFCEKVAQLPLHQLWRHNVSGDLPKSQDNKDNIDGQKLAQLVKANKGRHGYTYTHYELNAHNLELIKTANNKGFIVNASCETTKKADQAIKEGIPAVLVVDSEKEIPTHTEDGHKIIQCPATCQNVTCATCGLCAKGRKTVVAFPAHGNAKKKVNQILQEV